MDDEPLSNARFHRIARAGLSRSLAAQRTGRFGLAPAALAVAACLLLSPADLCAELGPVILGGGANLVSESADWQPQDYVDSRAIGSVSYDASRKSMAAVGDFIGGDPQKAQGEIFLDLRFFFDIEGKAPLDLTRGSVRAEVEAPAGFGHTAVPGAPEVPNGMQLFFKDEQFRSCYGPWVNTRAGQDRTIRYRLRYAFSRPSEAASVDADFDASKVIIVGVKFGIGAGSAQAYSGPLYLKSCRMSPTVGRTRAPTMRPPPSLFTGSDTISIENGRFMLNASPWFVVGANWRGIEYGQNFGANAWWPSGNGIVKHSHYADSYLRLAQQAGITVLRVGLGEDGRVLLAPDGSVVGYDAIFRADVQRLLDMADARGIRIQFTLVDFLMGGRGETVSGVQVRGHGHVFSSPAVRQGFVQNFLAPFLGEFAGHPAWISTDLVNEPEWLISSAEGGAWEGADRSVRPSAPLAIADLRAFVNDCVAAIKAAKPGMLVTVGVSSNRAGLVAGMPIDYYALHHYNGYGNLAQHVVSLPDDKPWVLEEFATLNAPMPLTDYLGFAEAFGGSGALLWNLHPGIDDATYALGSRTKLLREVRKWVLAQRKRSR